MWRRLGDQLELARALNGLAKAAGFANDIEAVNTAAREAGTLGLEVGDHAIVATSLDN
jgi:hypothetical protein